MPGFDNQSAASPGIALTHLDEQGRAKMVDVGWKPVTDREAVARGSVQMQPDTLKLIVEGQVKKGGRFHHCAASRHHGRQENR